MSEQSLEYRQQKLQDARSDRAQACWDMLLKIGINGVATVLDPPQVRKGDRHPEEQQKNTKWWWSTYPSSLSSC